MSNSSNLDFDNLDEFVSWQSGPKQRGAFGIIWSCIAIIVTCTWTVLHLNVPASSDGFWITLQRKLKWMIVMMIFPEFVFSHAILELKMALDDYISMSADNERLEYFLSLGWCAHPPRNMRVTLGILSAFSMTFLGRPDASQDALGDPDTLEPFIKELAGSLPQPPEEDASQGQQDGVGFLDRQKCWQHRCFKWTLTHSYFANMGGVVLPLKVDGNNRKDYDRYVTIQSNYLLSSLDHARALMATNHFSEDEILDKSKADNFVRVLWILQILRLILELCTRAFYHYAITQLEVIAVSFTAISFLTVIVQIKKPQDVGRPIILQGRPMPSMPHTLLPASLCATYLQIKIGDVNDNKPQMPRFPNDNFRLTESNKSLFQNMLTLSTITFGVIHCAAWNFHFSSWVEKWIWRACSLVGAVLPLLILLAIVLFLDPYIRTPNRVMHEKWKQVRWYKDRINDKLDNKYRWNHPLHPRFLKLNSNISDSHVLHVKDWRDKLEYDLLHRYFHHYGAAPPDIQEELQQMRLALDETLRISMSLKNLLQVFDLVQMGAIVVYLGSRILILVIGFMSFRLAPRGVYRDTWTGFLPTVQ